MKYLKQFAIILLITFIGEVLKAFIPLTIPASIYGLVLMLLALQTGLIKLDSVQDAGVFLIEIMPVMFIPAAVGLMDSWAALKPIFIPIAVITFVTTVIVLAVTGGVTQLVINMEKRK
ncbi:CidA/LrgA family protein [Aminipila butyrica]|uniref:CidA/LrgA family protein n=1 Tax=Aminipila butyrica TaxID=433296 RepID=A0A858BZL0_9FIRM|nr:CidA/LrgA family protein [Aminipila butyrica]QIB70575.1 CidA/LrgA family protein [Aminipila butyrica]